MPDHRPNLIEGWGIAETDLYEELGTGDPGFILNVSSLKGAMTVRWRTREFSCLKIMAHRLDVPVSDSSTHDGLLGDLVVAWCAKLAEYRNRPKFNLQEKVVWRTTGQIVREGALHVTLRVTGFSHPHRKIEVTETRTYWVDPDDIEKAT